MFSHNGFCRDISRALSAKVKNGLSSGYVLGLAYAYHGVCRFSRHSHVIRAFILEELWYWMLFGDWMALACLFVCIVAVLGYCTCVGLGWYPQSRQNIQIYAVEWGWWATESGWPFFCWWFLWIVRRPLSVCSIWLFKWPGSVIGRGHFMYLVRMAALPD